MRKIFILFIVLFCINSAYAANNSSFSVVNIPTIEKNALKKYKHVKTQNKYTKQMRQAGEQAYKSYNQKKMQGMINTYESNILSSKEFAAAFKKYVPKNQMQRIKYSRIGAHDKLFIFVSSSMPMSEIRRYVKDAALLNEPDIQFVIRGFIGGVKYIKPTIRFFYKAAKVDPYCKGLRCKMYNISLDVNPLPFRKYHIDRVPAFVFDPIFQKISKANINRNDNAYKLYGDVNLKYAIKTLYDNSKYLRLKELLDKFTSKAFFHQ